MNNHQKYYQKYRRYKKKYQNKLLGGDLDQFLIAEIDEFAPDCYRERNYYDKISNGEFPERSRIDSEGACYARSKKIQKTRDIIDIPYDEEDPEPYYPYLEVAQKRIKKVWGRRKPECYWNPKTKTCHNYVTYRTRPFNVRREGKNKINSKSLSQTSSSNIDSLSQTSSFNRKSLSQTSSSNIDSLSQTSSFNSNTVNSESFDNESSSDSEDDDIFYDARSE